MRKLLIGLFVILLAQPVIDPEPVDVNPALKGEPWAWEMYGKVIAWYQRVDLPDGTNQIIKIKPESELEKVPKTEAWQTIVDKIDFKPEPEPKICPTCGGPMP